MALEIWTNATGGVMLRDLASGECRDLKDVQSVTFIDGTVFPSSKQVEAPETKTIRTLGGAAVGVKS